jgi:outer membrane protein OmpA-like peptidoglycan-associated protein
MGYTKDYDAWGITVSAYELSAESGIGVDEYLSDVDAALQQISHAATGRAILSAVRASGWVLIGPHTGEDAARDGYCNAADEGDMHEVKLMRNSTSTSMLNVHFTPEIYGATSPCSKGPAKQPDSVLLHELVHAGRHLSRVFKKRPLPRALDGYEDQEEFFAILVQDIYLSESGRKTLDGRNNLRGAHDNKTTEDGDPKAFLCDPAKYDLVKQYWDESPNVAPLIAQVDTDFNPIQLYSEWKDLSPMGRASRCQKTPDEDISLYQKWAKDGTVIAVPGEVLFDTDKAFIRSEAIPKLHNVGQFIFNKLKSGGSLARSPSGRLIRVHKNGTDSPGQSPQARSYVIVYGHTDSTGPAAYNQTLSEGRARVVAQWLIDNNYVTADEVKSRGLGSSDPKAPNTTAEGRQKNRRVEFVIVQR